MRRYLLTFASALSLMLFAASTILWVRSYYCGDQVGWFIDEWNGGTGTDRGFGFDSDSGGIVFFFDRRETHLDLSVPAHVAFRIANPPANHPTWIVHKNYGYPYMTNYPGAGSFGFGYYGGDQVEPLGPVVCDDILIVVPGWVPPLIAAVLPVAWIMRWRRGRPANPERSLVHCDGSRPRSWLVLDVLIGLTMLAVALIVALG